jgi:hypothetical protein
MAAAKTPSGNLRPDGPKISSDDASSQALSEALGSSLVLIRLLGALLLAAFVFSCVFTVKPNEVAVVLRFGKPDQAAHLLKEAWTRAFSARADAIALQAYLELMPTLVKDVAGLQQAELVATAMVERLGRTPRREGQLAFKLGNSRYDLGDYAGAARDFEHGRFEGIACEIEGGGQDRLCSGCPGEGLDASQLPRHRPGSGASRN